jgi:hypothetical protein
MKKIFWQKIEALIILRLFQQPGFRLHEAPTPVSGLLPTGSGLEGTGSPQLFTRTLLFIDRMYANMKLQDFFQEDLTLIGLRNQYSPIAENSVFVNSNCIVAKDKILTKGKHYLIFDVPTKSEIKMTEVILVDLFYYKSNVHLIVQDINTSRVYKVHFGLEYPEHNCTMILVDVNYFIDRADDRAIKDYCGCDTNKKQTVRKGKIKAADDLLEFEF